MIVKLNENVINLITNNKSRFEMTIPNLGDIYAITEINTFPNVNNGKPVIELEKVNGSEWLKHIPLELFTKEELIKYNI